eukprot:TRINITY_DN19603_c0_g1_i1.p1 TRINITY_DN19603_c0_g1~~TRINITY_DN19603_c0_g1_i1.p1  ORF type:complete len:328 (+),score=43.88 TRINITY_DN19603_c0_g1_i1:60-986(+)
MDDGAQEHEVSGNKAATIVFYAGSGCPYTQRVWIGLEEKAIDYQWVDIDIYRKTNTDGDSNPNARGRWLLPMEELKQIYPNFVACSPRGQLPALENGGEKVHDSTVLLEYVHEAFIGPPLLPTSPYARAQVRLWSKHVDLHIVPNYERLLAAHDQETRSLAREDLLRGLSEFQSVMAPLTEGPFFLGDDFSMADMALAPWWQRMCSVLRAYRKFDPTAFPRLQAWFEAVEARPSFAQTSVDPEKLIEDFSYCADPDIEEGTRFRRGKIAGNVSSNNNKGGILSRREDKHLRAGYGRSLRTLSETSSIP